MTGVTDMKRPGAGRIWLAAMTLLLAMGGVGCEQNRMMNQKRIDPLEEDEFFEHGQSARPLPPGTVPRGHARVETEYYTGRYGVDDPSGGKPVGRTQGEADGGAEVKSTAPGQSQAPGPVAKARAKAAPSGQEADAPQANAAYSEYTSSFPVEVDMDLMRRGRNQYNSFCAPCHGTSGHGEGMVTQRGFPEPPSYHTQRMRQAPVGYYFDVITNGFGMMYSYASRVSPRDRWAIIAYIRALQVSQNVQVDTLEEDVRNQLEGDQ